jgi:hypothetical protein
MRHLQSTYTFTTSVRRRICGLMALYTCTSYPVCCIFGCFYHLSVVVCRLLVMLVECICLLLIVRILGVQIADRRLQNVAVDGCCPGSWVLALISLIVCVGCCSVFPIAGGLIRE